MRYNNRVCAGCENCDFTTSPRGAGHYFRSHPGSRAALSLSMSNSSRPPPFQRASLSRYVYLPFQRLQLTRNCNSCNIIYNGAFPVHRPPVTSYDEQSGDIKHIKICGSERFSTLGARASALTLVKKTAITGVRPNTKSIRGKSRGRVPYSLSTRFATRPRHYFGS